MNFSLLQDRSIYPKQANVGTIGENTVTEITLDVPDIYESYGKQIVFNTTNGSYVYAYTDSFTLPAEVLTDNIIHMQVVMKQGTNEWKSEIATLFLNNTLDDSNSNPATQAVESIKTAQREVDRLKLIDALEQSDINLNASVDYEKMLYSELLLLVENTTLANQAQIADIEHGLEDFCDRIESVLEG